MPDATALELSPQEQKFASGLVEALKPVSKATKERCAQTDATP